MRTPAEADKVSEKPKKQPSRKRSRSPSNAPVPRSLKKPRDQTTLNNSALQKNTSGKPTKYGSYRNYYNRRLSGNDPSTDDRLPLIRQLCNAYERFSVLDVGCNDGKLTIEVAKNNRCVRAVGVDIDGKLIRNARSSLRHHAQKQMKEKKAKAKNCSPSPSSVSFPFNTAFRTEDLSTEQASQSLSEQYHIVLCLSVTKWVHINGGDEALQRLFNRMYKCLKAGGVLILEPQPVKSYKLARQKGLAPKESSFDHLKMKPSMFSNFLLEQCGFSDVRMLRDKRPSGKAFNRPIYAFFKGNDAVSLRRFDEHQNSIKQKEEESSEKAQPQSKSRSQMSGPPVTAYEKAPNDVGGNGQKTKPKQIRNRNPTAEPDIKTSNKESERYATVGEAATNGVTGKQHKKKSKRRSESVSTTLKGAS